MKRKIFLILSIAILQFGIDVEALTCTKCQQDVASGKRGTASSVTDFGDLTKCTTFIDKTKMIEAFFNYASSSQFQLITTPHKFGKTINLNMLKKFVEVKVDEDGDTMIKSDTDVYKMFTDSKLNLQIAPLMETESSPSNEHFGQYPTIYLTFKDLHAHSYEAIVKGIRENIKTCFESYEWVYRGLKDEYSSGDEGKHPTAVRQVKLMTKILNGEGDEEDIVNSLFVLSKILFNFFSYEQVFVIIDDYDQPVLNAIEHNLNVTRVHRLMERMYAKLFNPDHRFVKYALLAGTVNILHKAKFSHIKHWAFLDSPGYAEYFGFTGKEVRDLMSIHGLSDIEQNLMTKYYASYQVFDTTMQLYNPFSIVKHLCCRHPDSKRVVIDNHWTEKGVVSDFLKIFGKIKIYRELLVDLASSPRITFSLMHHFGLDELKELRHIMHEEDIPLTDFRADLFFSYLFASGFLSYTEEENVFVLPNNEVKSYLGRLFLGVQRQDLEGAADVRYKFSNGGSLYQKIIDKLFG